MLYKYRLFFIDIPLKKWYTLTSEYVNYYVTMTTYRNANGSMLAYCADDGMMKDASGSDMGINQFAYEAQGWYCPIVYPDTNTDN